MNSYKKNIMHLIFCIISFFIGATLLVSCNEAVEGCMEPQASNFNPEADTDCCCTYFKITPNFYLTGNRLDTFRLDSIYLDANQDSFRLLNLNLLGSEWSLRPKDLSTGLSTAVTSINLKQKDNTRVLAQDGFFWIDQATATTVGVSWTEAFRYDSLRFRIGLPSGLKTTDQASIESTTHPLALSTLTVGDSLAGFGLRIHRLRTDDTIRYLLLNSYELGVAVDFTFLHDQENTFPLGIDMTDLLKNITFELQDSATVVKVLEQNIQSSFFTY
jgi:hypothetical protein